MQHGINIFGYGLTQLFTNLGAAFRLTGLIWLAASLVIYAIGYVMVGAPIAPMSLRPDVEGQMPALSASFSMIGLVINLLAAAWVMMIWSRFCLGLETPNGWMPTLKGQSFGGVLLALILVVASVGACAYIASLVMSLVRPYMPLLVGLFVAPLIVFLLLIALTLRIGSTIPASAASSLMPLTAAWNASQGLGLWLVTILAFMTITILTFPSIFLAGAIIPGNILSILGSWLVLLIGTGWLVAIYKHSEASE